jgi:hypothetical protein
MKFNSQQDFPKKLLIFKTFNFKDKSKNLSNNLQILRICNWVRT